MSIRQVLQNNAFSRYSRITSITRELLYLILLNIIFSLYWVPTKHWAQLQLQVHIASRTHMYQHRTHQHSPPIMSRGNPITLLNRSNMVLLWVTKQRYVANNTARTTDFATAPSRPDIAKAMVPPDVRLSTIATDSVAAANETSVSDAMVPPSDDQIKTHTLSMPTSHHRATLLLRHADVGRFGGYDVGYDECAHTNDFVTALGRLDIARVYDSMVPPAEYQPKQHTLLTTTSHHW